MSKRVLTIVAVAMSAAISACESTTIQYDGGCELCDDTQICCNGYCVQPQIDSKNCGECGVICKEGEACIKSSCRSTVDACGGCKEGLECCGTTCVNLQGNDENCGTCGNACDPGSYCSHAKCVPEDKPLCDETCTGDNRCCGDACISVKADVKNCGECGHACDSGEICEDGACKPSCICEDGSACKADGTCGGECADGTCEPPCVCEDGSACEADGTCAAKCGGKVCSTEEICCSDTCVNANTAEHCGSCDKSCAGDTPVCSNGSCISSCQSGQKLCDTSCVDLSTDKSHCGNCTTQCQDNEKCEGGTCVCTPKTCPAGKNCGEIDDGCGKKISCGSCTGNQSCQNNVCTCTPTTCKAAGKSCGEIDDGCGKKISCGSCTGNQSCQSNVCTCTPTTCQATGKNCGEIDDGCGKKISCGSCTGSQKCENNVCKAAATTKDIYPTRKSIKGLQPDFMNMDEIIGNAVHGVAMNMVWQVWQPTATGNCASGQVKYDGYCYNVDANTANTIKRYTDAGVVVTAVVYGVPSWARRSCTGVVADYFCAPTTDGAKHYGRFVGFLANYFNGEQGHGRIADFVIHNEVNATEWFNYGCSANTCDLNTWTSVYAESYNAAYDYAIKEQKQAKVLISLEHNWSKSYMSNARPVAGGEAFLKSLIPKLGTRDWRIAYHAYPPNLLNPAFGADDYVNSGTITFGNIGVLAGWLRKNYPNDPHAWEIQLTENGIQGSSSYRSQQQTQLCQAFKNLLGTPGVESFIYHRLKDHPDEGALQLGLWAGSTNDGHPNPAKPAWTTYALANRSDAGAGWPSCGFEFLPYVEMMRGSNNGMHWVTTRQMPTGFKKEQSWKILRDKPAKESVLVYECRVGGANGGHAMISPDANCENQFNMGPMGYLYKNQEAGTTAVYRCRNDKTGSHFISSDSNCEGSVTEYKVGYAIKL